MAKPLAVYGATITLRKVEVAEDAPTYEAPAAPTIEAIETAVASALEALYGGLLTVKVEAQRTDK